MVAAAAQIRRDVGAILRDFGLLRFAAENQTV